MKFTLKSILETFTSQTQKPGQDVPGSIPPVGSDSEYKTVDPHEALQILQKYKNALAKKGINLPGNPKSLGNGKMGTAFDLGQNVLKVTGDQTEARASRHLVGKKLANVCPIYAVYELDSTKTYAIHQKKLQKIPYDKSFLMTIERMYLETVSQAQTAPIQQVIQTEIRPYFKNQEDANKVIKLATDVSNARKQLKEVGIDWPDYHLGNIMYDAQTKNFCAIDLGVSKSGDMPIEKI